MVKGLSYEKELTVGQSFLNQFQAAAINSICFCSNIFGLIMITICWLFQTASVSDRVYMANSGVQDYKVYCCHMALILQQFYQ